MKNAIASIMALGLISALPGCAIDDQTASPDQASSSSDVTIRPRWSKGRNFVRSCTPLALRTCDNPGACDTGARLATHSQVISDSLDSNTKMAHLTSPVGWALADNGDEVYLSAVDGPCN
jgi:hypothetical protein